MLERPSIDESGTPTAFAGGVPASHAAAPKARRKPRLRGVSHQIAAFASLPAAGALVLRAKSATGTTGAAIYAVRRPDPLPDVFGFHEVFHLLVVAAAVCHFLVVDAAIQAMR